MKSGGYIYIWHVLCKYGILTKTGTYISLKLNLVIFVNFSEKIREISLLFHHKIDIMLL